MTALHFHSPFHSKSSAIIIASKTLPSSGRYYDDHATDEHNKQQGAGPGAAMLLISCRNTVSSTLMIAHAATEWLNALPLIWVPNLFDIWSINDSEGHHALSSAVMLAGQWLSEVLRCKLQEEHETPWSYQGKSSSFLLCATYSSPEKPGFQHHNQIARRKFVDFWVLYNFPPSLRQYVHTNHQVEYQVHVCHSCIIGQTTENLASDKNSRYPEE